jgi:hypothetical protein
MQNIIDTAEPCHLLSPVSNESMYPLKVQVIELDTSRTRPSPNAPERRMFYFKLSVAPPEEAVELFDRTWTVPRGAVWRQVKIEGDYLLIDCQPQEVVNVYLSAIKRDLRTACKRYNKLMKARLQGSMREKESHEAELELLKGGWWPRLKWLVRSWNENLWL